MMNLQNNPSSPLPWRIINIPESIITTENQCSPGSQIVDASGMTICFCPSQDDAKIIVDAVNKTSNVSTKELPNTR